MTGFRPSRRQVIATAAFAAFPLPAFAEASTLRITQTAALRTSAGLEAAPGMYREHGAVSPDGRLVALAPNEAMAIFDATTGAEVDAVAGGANRDYTAVFSPDSQALIVGSYRTIRAYDVQAKRVRWRMRFDPSLVWDPWTLSYRPGAAQIAVSGSSDIVVLLDATDGRLIREFRGHTDMVGAHSFTPDGARLVTGPDTAGGVVVWDVETGEAVQRLTVSPGSWSGVSRDGQFLICTRTHSAVDVWSVATGARVHGFPATFSGTTRLGAAGRLRGALAGPNGEWLIVGAERTNEIQIFDWSTGQRLLAAPIEGGGPNALAVFPDGTTLLYGDPARIWSIGQN